MKTQGWFDFRDFYDFIFRQFNKGVFVEIGAWKGQSVLYMAQRIKESGKNIKLYGIDAFEGTPDDYVILADDDLRTGNLYNAYLQTIAPVKDIITTIVGSSHEVHDRFADDSIDFLFIDGDHRYVGISKDIDLWYPKVKNRGIISGYDYEKSAFCGVKDAVDERFDKVGQFGRCWFYNKKI